MTTPEGIICDECGSTPCRDNCPSLSESAVAACSTPIKDILAERRRQDQKWGENHHPLKWLAILGEEVGESNKAILEGSLVEYRDELVQVAAVALAAIECLERGTWDQQA